MIEIENATLEEVKSRFEQWRTSRRKKTRIPDELRKQVLALLKQYPKTKVLRTLGINSSQLKDWIKIKPTENKASAIQFIPIESHPLTHSQPSLEHNQPLEAQLINSHSGIQIQVKCYSQQQLADLLQTAMRL